MLIQLRFLLNQVELNILEIDFFFSFQCLKKSFSIYPTILLEKFQISSFNLFFCKIWILRNFAPSRPAKFSVLFYYCILFLKKRSSK